MFKRLSAVLCGISLAGCGLVAASNPSADNPTSEKKGPLAALPSPPGEHIEKIKALGDNSWLNLGPPKADPQWGKARGRSWTPEMPYAPNLRGAFLFGEGVHGYAKPDGHYMDDLWFYDINAHGWICVYPGADCKKLKLHLDERGFEVNDRGEPIPVAEMGHGYCNATYDTDRKLFMFVARNSPYWHKALPQREQWLARGKPASPRHPWFYDIAADRWQRKYVEGGGPDQFGHHEGELVYVPTRKQAYWRYKQGEVWLYDYASNSWTNTQVKGPRPPTGIDSVACYDSKRDRVYSGGGGYPWHNVLWIYDVKANTWIDAQAKNQERIGTYGGNPATLQYDVANDVVVLVLHKEEPESRGVNIYDPETNVWNEAPLPLPEEVKGQCWNSFYDPELNVHFFHLAHDSRDNGVIWVYRYKRARIEEAEQRADA